MFLWPRLAPLLVAYPDIKVESKLDYGLTDIVAQRFDAGVRLGDQVEKDMVTPPMASGQLQSVLQDCCPLVPGYHLYYPSRRQASPAFRLLVDTLRQPD